MISKINDNAVSSAQSVWTSRAGVVLGYQPEDTMKSFIFNEHNRHSLKLNNKDNQSILTKSEIDRALAFLTDSEEGEDEESSLTKETIKDVMSEIEESSQKIVKPSYVDTDQNLEQRITSSRSNEENDSTAAYLSSDSGEHEFETDVISTSNMSFEEILEKKLQQDKSNKNVNINFKIEPASKPKFTFLRKNSGKAAWSSNVKKNLKNERSLSNDRDTFKGCPEKSSNNMSHRRLKSMPNTSRKIEINNRDVEEKRTKNTQKTVHFAEKSDHEMSSETLDTGNTFERKKHHNKNKENSDRKNCDAKVNEEVDKELIEFELLEQIANVSMSSTTSSLAKFDEDMLRERVLKIQTMPPPKIRLQNQYFEEKKTSEINNQMSMDHSKPLISNETAKGSQPIRTYESDDDEDSTTLSKFSENPVPQASNLSKKNPVRKISKQNDRQKSNYLDINCNNDDSWTEESPFQLSEQRCERIEQAQNNSVHNLPPINWNFADPFQQSDSSSDDESSRSSIGNQEKEAVQIKNIFPKIVVNKKEADPDNNIGVQSAKLKQWVQLLETEIKRFNKENEEIAKIKNEQEQGLKRLENQMNEFSKHKEEESKQFEEYKQKEIKKLKKERKVFEEYQEAMKNMPNKKDREEIEKLKSEIQSSKEEAINKESRWQSVNTRSKQKIEQLESENTEMHSRIHSLEQKRLQLQAQLISASNQVSLKSVDSNNTKQKPTLTSVTQALSMKHTNNPIGIATKDDNNSNKCINSPRIPIFNKKPVNKVPAPVTKVIKSVKKVDVVNSNNVRVDVRGSAASDYYTGEEETGSTDSHINGPFLTTIRDNMPPTINMSYNMKINRSSDTIKEEIRHQDGILEKVYLNGGVDVIYPNGSLKQISSDGKTTIIHLYNGDIKQMTPDGRIVYFYSQDGSTQTTFSDGREEILYKSGQKEVVHPSGIREVHFPDRSIKILHPDSREENILPNGLIIRVNGSGDKEILMPNGQKEIHSKGIKKRIYPDGTTKTVYSDGRQETYYASGRMRVKDINGILLLDQYIDKDVGIPHLKDTL